MIKSDVNPVDALRRTPRRSRKNSNLNRGGMSNNNKICFRCGGVYPYKVKFPTFVISAKICLKKCAKRRPLCKMLQNKINTKVITTMTTADIIRILDKYCINYWTNYSFSFSSSRAPNWVCWWWVFWQCWLFLSGSQAFETREIL